MQLSLPPELEREIDARVRSGQYCSASEVVDEALRQLFIDEAWSPALDDLDARIAAGMAQLDRGEGVPGNEAQERSRARLAAG